MVFDAYGMIPPDFVKPPPGQMYPGKYLTKCIGTHINT